MTPRYLIIHTPIFKWAIARNAGSFFVRGRMIIVGSIFDTNKAKEPLTHVIVLLFNTCLTQYSVSVIPVPYSYIYGPVFFLWVRKVRHVTYITCSFIGYSITTVRYIKTKYRAWWCFNFHSVMAWIMPLRCSISILIWAVEGVIITE